MTKATTITKTQAQVLADAIRNYAQAQASFETWFRTCYWVNGSQPFFGTFEDAVEKHYGFFARRDQPNDIDGYYKKEIDWVRGYYEMFRSGVVEVHASSNTIKALEKKGLIEIIYDGKRGTDRIRLLYV